MGDSEKPGVYHYPKLCPTCLQWIHGLCQLDPVDYSERCRSTCLKYEEDRGKIEVGEFEKRMAESE